MNNDNRTSPEVMWKAKHYYNFSAITDTDQICQQTWHTDILHKCRETPTFPRLSNMHSVVQDTFKKYLEDTRWRYWKKSISKIQDEDTFEKYLEDTR